jgi:hypothetical protein
MKMQMTIAAIKVLLCFSSLGRSSAVLPATLSALHQPMVAGGNVLSPPPLSLSLPLSLSPSLPVSLRFSFSWARLHSANLHRHMHTSTAAWPFRDRQLSQVFSHARLDAPWLKSSPKYSNSITWRQRSEFSANSFICIPHKKLCVHREMGYPHHISAWMHSFRVLGKLLHLDTPPGASCSEGYAGVPPRAHGGLMAEVLADLLLKVSV